jgi:hypothetical protein
VGVDQGEEPFQQLGRQVVAHAFDDLEAGAGDGLRGVDAAGRRHERIGRAVDHERGRGDRLQLRGAVAAGRDGQHLAHDATGAAVAAQRARDAAAQVFFRRRIRGAADGLQQLDVVVDGAVDVAGAVPAARPAQQCAAGGLRRARQAAAAAAGHDRREAEDARREPRRHQLPDHAAHRYPDDMGTRHTERGQHADGIVGHVFQAVRRAQGQAQHGLQPGQREAGRAGMLELGGQAAVAIIETDHVKAQLDEAFDEFVGPGRQLQAEAGNQQQWHGFRIARGVEGDADPVGVQTRHGGVAGTGSTGSGRGAES